MKLMLKVSQFNYIGMIPLFTIVVILVPNWYTVGVWLGLLALVLAHFAWARKSTTVAPQTTYAMQEELVDTEE
jgi:hypothetical protein